MPFLLYNFDGRPLVSLSLSFLICKMGTRPPASLVWYECEMRQGLPGAHRVGLGLRAACGADVSTSTEGLKKGSSAWDAGASRRHIFQTQYFCAPKMYFFPPQM